MLWPGRQAVAPVATRERNRPRSRGDSALVTWLSNLRSRKLPDQYRASAWLPRDPVVRAILIVFFTLAIVVVGVFSYFYVKYDRVIVKRFSSPVFSNSAHIYAAAKSRFVPAKRLFRQSHRRRTASCRLFGKE